MGMRREVLGRPNNYGPGINFGAKEHQTLLAQFFLRFYFLHGHLEVGAAQRIGTAGSGR